MSLANGETNKFFTDPNKDEDRYYEEGFTIENSYNNYVAILVNEVPDNSVVLDIGCAQGKFGKALSEKQCTVYGVELNPVSARHAINTGYYEDIFIYDITSSNASEYERMVGIIKQADVIIFADVLEHLSEPTSVLHRYSNLLKDEGIILVSVPNIAHADIALNLLNGKFNYTDTGILDNTHLKFFTKRSFLEWIDLYNNVYSDTVFDCEYLNSSFYYSDYLTLVRNKYNTLFRLLETNKEFNALQLLFKLTKLPKGEVARNLLEALQEKPLETVDMIGSALEGSFKERLDILPTMLRSERSWYEYAITNYTDQIERKEWEVSKQEERINALLKYVSELEKDSEQKNANISELGLYTKKLEEELQKRDERIDALLKYVSELEKDSEQKNANISELDLYTKRLEENLQQRDDRIEELLKYVSELEKDSEQKNANISELDLYTKRLEENLQQRDDRIEELLKYVSELEKDSEQKNANISELDLYTKKLEEELQKRDERIVEIQKYISELEEDVQKSKASITQLEDRNEELLLSNNELKRSLAESQEKIDKLTEDLRKSRETILQMEHSLSWKVTKFLRKN
jgi:2-polyprenyl-3-methyl-5-hydroxy-6-metoxy-1,4-benzoquinol methylase/septal ring factor EnvC (AmiA/AmiB activator)